MTKSGAPQVCHYHIEGIAHLIFKLYFHTQCILLIIKKLSYTLIMLHYIFCSFQRILVYIAAHFSPVLFLILAYIVMIKISFIFTHSLDNLLNLDLYVYHAWEFRNWPRAYFEIVLMPLAFVIPYFNDFSRWIQ